MSTNNDFLNQLIDKLAPNQKDVQKWIDGIKKENPELTNDEIVENVCDYIIISCTKQGAALSLPGAIPVLGTIAQISVEVGATSVDIALLVRNSTYLVFALGAIYGVKERKVLIQDTLLTIGLWSNAIILTKEGTIRIGEKIVTNAFKKKFPAQIFKTINKKVGRTILTKYGVKRGGVAIGKLIPFGVGIVVGGGFNYLMMKKFAKQTKKYFNLKIN